MLYENINKIKHIFKENKVIFSYLFGSQVNGKKGKLSDIDIAVYLDDNLPEKQRFNKKLSISAGLSGLLKREDIDIVVLNDAFPLLEHRILKYGKIIFSIDEKKRIGYEVRATMRYLDFKPFIDKYTKETIYGR